MNERRKSLANEKENIGIIINRDKNDKRFHVILGFPARGGFAESEVFHSQEIFLEAVKFFEGENDLSPVQAKWFRDQLENLPDLLKTEKEAIMALEAIVRKQTNETGQNPAGIKKVGSDPDFYVFISSTNKWSRSFCNKLHGFDTVGEMLIGGKIPTDKEAEQIHERIATLNIPNDINEANSARTDVDMGTHKFPTGIERRGNKARIVPPCGAALPLLSSKEALYWLLDRYHPHGVRGGQEEIDHVFHQIQAMTDFPEDMQPGDEDALIEYEMKARSARGFGAGDFMLDPRNPLVAIMAAIARGEDPTEGLMGTGGILIAVGPNGELFEV